MSAFSRCPATLSTLWIQQHLFAQSSIIHILQYSLTTASISWLPDESCVSLSFVAQGVYANSVLCLRILWLVAGFLCRYLRNCRLLPSLVRHLVREARHLPFPQLTLPELLNLIFFSLTSVSRSHSLSLLCAICNPLFSYACSLFFAYCARQIYLPLISNADTQHLDFYAFSIFTPYTLWFVLIVFVFVAVVGAAVVICHCQAVIVKCFYAGFLRIAGYEIFVCFHCCPLVKFSLHFRFLIFFFSFSFISVIFFFLNFDAEYFSLCGVRCFLSRFLWFHASRVCWHCHSTWPLQFALYPWDAPDACSGVVGPIIYVWVGALLLLMLLLFHLNLLPLSCSFFRFFCFVCCCFLLILYFLVFIPVASHLKRLSLTNYISCIMHKYTLPLIWFGCFL